MSCLFDSLAKFVNDTNTDTLRGDICHYLSANPKLIDGENVEKTIMNMYGISLPEYINKMSRSEVWGGAVEIKAFCDMFNVAVLVHHQGRKIEFLPNTKNLKGIIRLKYECSHYEPY